MAKTVLIMAGGTGGHVFPGLSLAEELAMRGYHVEWLGTRKGIEAKLVVKRNIPLHFINIQGVRGKGLLSLLSAPLKIVLAIKEALSIVKQAKPAVVVGLGGFASGPGGVAAKIAGNPLVVHEQNAVAGTTNRLLAKIANVKLVAFPESLRGGTYIGNPVRKEISELPSPEERYAEHNGPIRIFVLGGSRGARALNEVVPEAIAELNGKLELVVHHQTGETEHTKTLERYKTLNIDAEVHPFIDDMSAMFAWADCVICRSGALTISELAAAGVASILIPFPHATDDHQTRNAKFLADVGAAVICPQKELTKENLSQLLDEQFSDRKRLNEMAVKAKAMAMPGAVEKFADICEELCSV